jgi:hypothetical protein
MSKQKRDITPEESAQVESLAAHGHTQREIAHFLKISPTSFKRKLKEDSLLMASWRRGRFKGKEYVLSRLWRFIKNDELSTINLSAIQFYLRNTGFGTESNNDNNELHLSFGNKSAMEIINSTLTALEEGEINVPQAQQLTSLALAKLNIESRTQEDKAVSKEMKIEETRAFAKELEQVLKNIDILTKNIKK